MAVVVQALIPCEAGGVAFTADPLGGETVVIEAVRGLAEAVVQGTGEVTRYTLDRHSLACRQEATLADDVLAPAQVRLVAQTALALEAHFGGAQDVEWGLWNGELYLFQCRPVTTRAERFFTEVIPGDGHLWTGGYLNERFPQPVSPLGWSIVGGLTEELAFRDPLRYLGYRHFNQLPLTKLYRGHPYTNVAVFQILYKVFPDALVPDDAARYFPNGDTSLRKKAPYPCCLLDPRLIASMLYHFVREPANWSPLHNHRHWAQFAVRHERAMAELAQRLEDAAGRNQLWAIVEAAQRWNRELLGIHRWSLMAADLTVPLLGRLVGSWVSSERQAELSARLLCGLPNKSMELDQALRQLAGAAGPEAADLQGFLAEYGHRSFSLDIYHPTFTDEPEQVLRLLEVAGHGPDVAARVAARESAEREVRATIAARPLGRLKLLILNQVLALTRRYVSLREDQRFAWQRTLALMRRVFLHIGARLAAEGCLTQADDTFFATFVEIRDLSQPAQLQPDTCQEVMQAIAARRVAFERLHQEFELASHLTYPAFLRGNRPLEITSDEKVGRWQGVPVSPGLVRGPVRVVLTPGQFGRIAPGDILVTRSTDPGWTPIFGRLGGLIMERGGQLSHGSVIAREYGLPAVVGIPHITAHLCDDDLVLLDGLTGTVFLEGRR
jgi:phosphohistidine swiveling domain-containing protein